MNRHALERLGNHIVSRRVALEPAPADTVCDAFDFHGWAVRAASVRGLQHRHGETVRQDTYAVRFSADTGRLVVVVCDGVGGESNSHLAEEAAAAELARVAIGAEQAAIASDGWWLAAYRAASERIMAEQGHLPERPMSTTATTVVLDGVGGTGPLPMTCAGVGDSSVWLAAGTGTRWQRLLDGKADDSPILSTVVSALSFRRDIQSVAVRRHVLRGHDLLLMCSDGIGDTFADGTSAVAATLSEDWCAPPRALNFAAQIGFVGKGFVDDRTGVAIWAPGI